MASALWPALYREAINQNYDDSENTMTIKQQRTAAIEFMVDQFKYHLKDGVNLESINRAKQEVMTLCELTELFPRTDFPVPDEQTIERFYQVYEDDRGEYALYVNSAIPCQTYRPHNHGGSWAIIAAIEGAERHSLYEPETDKTVNLVNEIVVKPGTAVSMLEDGIHSIQAEGNQPLLHLHFYGCSFAKQGLRTEYNLDNKTAERFYLDDPDFVEDAR